MYNKKNEEWPLVMTEFNSEYFAFVSPQRQTIWFFKTETIKQNLESYTLVDKKKLGEKGEGRLVPLRDAIKTISIPDAYRGMNSYSNIGKWGEQMVMNYFEKRKTDCWKMQSIYVQKIKRVDLLVEKAGNEITIEVKTDWNIGAMNSQCGYYEISNAEPPYHQMKPWLSKKLENKLGAADTGKHLLEFDYYCFNFEQMEEKQYKETYNAKECNF